jgi:hypothetical protein
MRTTPAVLLGGLVGLGLGVVLTTWAQRSSDESVRRHFEARLGCKDFAVTYVQEHDPSLRLDGSDFSPARNACVASVSKAWNDRGYWEYRIINLTRGEDIFSKSCDQSKGNCGNAALVQESGDRCYEHALRERSECQQPH